VPFKVLLLFICLPFSALGQNTIGLPDVINYPKLAYGAGLQSWDIRQANNGIIYFANNEGLLSFDGTYWKVYPLPNKTIVRSVEIAADNNIYAGGQDELGFFAPASNGKLVYHSLTELIPGKDRIFGDVWDIVSVKNDIFFRSPHKIFKLTNRAFKAYEAPAEWSFMGICNGRLFAHDVKNGLFVFENNGWFPLSVSSELPANDLITALLPINKDSTLITTLKNGLFVLSPNRISKLKTSNNSIFEKERIYAATTVNKNWVALATNNGGVYITDLQGQIIQAFSKTEGLQNNNVLSIFLDKESNLWLGLNNGIDFIAYNSAVKHISPYPQDGSGYTAIIHQNQLYTGTSNGLFMAPLQPAEDLSFSKGNFSLVNNSNGQTWCLADINGKLLLGHHEGAFVVNENKAVPISTGPGYWNFLPVSDVFPTAKIISGNYRGLKFLDYSNGSFTEAANIPDFIESARFIALDNADNIWVSHPYHGVYKITPLAGRPYNWKLYTNNDGLPSTLDNHIYKVKNEVVVATSKGIYRYDSTRDRFMAAESYQKIFGDQSIRYLKEDKSGNIWFVHEKMLGVADYSSKEPAVIYLPELNNKLLSGFEFIYPVNEKNIFIGGEKGFFHINYEKYKKNTPLFQTQIRSVRIVNNKDSLLFGGYFTNVNEKQVQETGNIPGIANKWRTLVFEFSSTLFGQQANLEYSYRLKGFDANWTEWSRKTDKEYNSLPAGTYTFEVKARNNLGNESAPSSYTFKILPPWYQTIWAYLIYFFLVLTAIYFIYRWQHKKFVLQQIKYEEEQKRQQYLHQLELNKTESELVALRNEKLQSEIDFKNSELATSAMHLVQKGELLSKLKGELTQVLKGIDNPQVISEMKKLLKVLSEDDKMDKDWEHFAQHFDKVHSDFVVDLKEKYPNITANELKLCAYLRMNLTTKEIAQLMNTSIRGIETTRYRLRKKLGISSETTLFDYLINFNNKNN
jgi:ligand-binding sensor domain-containing protein/DNA-binding CsgD family transcriptional regulator